MTKAKTIQMTKQALLKDRQPGSSLDLDLVVAKSKRKSKTVQQQKQQHKAKLPLEINLDEPKNPNPAIKIAYTESGAIDQFYPFAETSEFQNEAKIFTFAAATKNNPDGQKIKHKIVSIYRIRQNDKEYCYFYNHMIVRDRLDNSYDWTRKIGKFELPLFNIDHGMLPSSSDPSQFSEGIRSTTIDRVDTIYSYTWEQIQPQIKKWRTEGLIADSCNFTVIFGTKRYTVKSWEEFINLKIEDLVLLNRTSLDVAGLFTGKDTLKEILQVARIKGKTALLKRLEQ